jgi:hypothetical protein
MLGRGLADYVPPITFEDWMRLSFLERENLTHKDTVTSAS